MNITNETDYSKSKTKPISKEEIENKIANSDPLYAEYLKQVLFRAKRSCDIPGETLESLRFEIDGYGAIWPFGERFYGYPQYSTCSLNKMHAVSESNK